MKKIAYTAGPLVIAVLLGFVLVKPLLAPKETQESAGQNNQATTTLPAASEDIEISAPLPGASAGSPLAFSGKARGTWFFEASFPVHVIDQDGSVLGTGIATAQGEWMTTDFVGFAGTVVFKTPKGKEGKLVFSKDNPSGLPEHDKSFSIPISFN